MSYSEDYDPMDPVEMKRLRKAMEDFHNATIPKDEHPIGFEIVRPDKTAVELEDEWACKLDDEQVFAQPHGKRPKKPVRLQPSMKALTKRRAKNKQARTSRKRNRK